MMNYETKKLQSVVKTEAVLTYKTAGSSRQYVGKVVIMPQPAHSKGTVEKPPTVSF
jgi:hypothetical protein